MQREKKRTVSRRPFLKAAGVMAFPMILPSGVFGAEHRLRIGCIGTGRMGRSNMFAVVSCGRDKGINAVITTVCDVDIHRARRAKKDLEKKYAMQGLTVNVEVYQDYREMLARADIDGVIIATPDHQHALTAMAAAEAKKDIYLQKPFTYSVVEGRKLVEAVRRNKIVLQTGAQQRSSQYFRKTIELVRNGFIGKLLQIEVVVPTDKGTGDPTPSPVPPNLNYDMWLGPTPVVPYTEDRVHPQKGFSRPGWLQIEAYCRGMVTGWGAHMYDIAQWGMGCDLDSGPVEVQATGEFPKRGLFDVHVGYHGEATYANGVKMFSHNGKPGVKFIGTDGWIWVQRGGFKAHDRNIFREKIPDNGYHTYVSSNHEADFLRCMRTRKDPCNPAEAGHRSNTVCVLHHIAMKLGRTLKWDPRAEKFIDDDEANRMLDYPHRRPWIV